LGKDSRTAIAASDYFFIVKQGCDQTLGSKLDQFAEAG
jgi:hypothetical protein